MSRKQRLVVIAVGVLERSQLYGSSADVPVREALAGGPYFLTDPLDPLIAGMTVGEVDLQVRLLADLPAGTPLYACGQEAGPGPRSADGNSAPTEGEPRRPPFQVRPLAEKPGTAGPDDVPPLRDLVRFPVEISDGRAVEIAHALELGQIGAFLRRQLSVLLTCDKLIVEHLAPLIAERSGAWGVMLQLQDDDQDQASLLSAPRSQRQRRLDALRAQLQELKENDFLIISHLDLLCAGSESALSADARDLVEVLYEQTDRLLLAFADPSIGVPTVVAERFAVRMTLAGTPRMVPHPAEDTEVPIGEVMVTSGEAELFAGYNAQEFHKHVTGLNPVRLREAVRYAYAEHQNNPAATGTDLRNTIRMFKAQMSASFEVPDVTLDDIGGYDDVKTEIQDALDIMKGIQGIPEGQQKLQSELMSRGFIFYGPPGTGKTLFAKAIANELNASIMVVSGPEVTDKFVGEGERKIRELFASARRNAPSVLVFDEFDAIAGRRSGRDDGGSRAGNAMVAQLLTELDGFREEVPFLVIGTTNQLDLIDPAMLRPSRFRPIRIGMPQVDARIEIIKVHAGRFGIEMPDELVELIAEGTDQRSGDDIQSIFRDAYVGEHLRGIPANARRLGELVGKLNRAAQEQRESTL
jgi:transitional endoplasmic reticulum ATPase